MCITINANTADPDPADTLVATFGQKLSDIALPNVWAIALIIIGGILLLGILALLILFIFFPVYYIDYSKREVRRAIYLRTKHGEVLMFNTHLTKVRRNENDVYEKKSDALNALNK